MARWHRFRAEHRTREVVTWTIGIVVMLALTVLVRWAAHQLGWSWP